MPPASGEKGERHHHTHGDEHGRTAEQARCPHEPGEPWRCQTMNRPADEIVEGKNFALEDFPAQPRNQHQRPGGSHKPGEKRLADDPLRFLRGW